MKKACNGVIVVVVDMNKFRSLVFAISMKSNNKLELRHCVKVEFQFFVATNNHNHHHHQQKRQGNKKVRLWEREVKEKKIRQ